MRCEHTNAAERFIVLVIAICCPVVGRNANVEKQYNSRGISGHQRSRFPLRQP